MNRVSEIHEGGCLCGAIRYHASGEPTALTLCHCHSCRKSAGAPSVAWTVFRAEGFRFIAGSPAVHESSPGVERSFCPTCGTSLTYRSTSRPDVMDVTTASLDEPNLFAPRFEIWVEEKLAWEAVDNTRPHYPRSRRTSRPLPSPR